MAKACDQCKRVPRNSDRGERYLWLKLEIPLGLLVNSAIPPEYSGLRRGFSTVADEHLFCSAGCVQAYMLLAGPRLDQVQSDAYEVMLEAGVLPSEAEDETRLD
jgi:hypothetical protein